MPFSEALKLSMKRRAHFSCCLCHTLGVEVHHIVPRADGGSDDEDNAAPLCPTCHETYGANPIKRKFIRECREFWYEICERRYAADPDRLDEITRLLQAAVTKADLDRAVDRITALLRDTAARPDRSAPELAKAVTHVSSIAVPGVGINRSCKKCGTNIGLFIGDQGRCPNCGAPW